MLFEWQKKYFFLNRVDTTLLSFLGIKIRLFSGTRITTVSALQCRRRAMFMKDDPLSFQLAAEHLRSLAQKVQK